MSLVCNQIIFLETPETYFSAISCLALSLARIVSVHRPRKHRMIDIALRITSNVEKKLVQHRTQASTPRCMLHLIKNLNLAFPPR